MRRPNTSGIGSGSPNRSLSVEIGSIDRVDREAGNATVITETGREITARISTPMGGIGGSGLRLTPRVGARCLVAILESGGAPRPNHSFLLSTYSAAQGDTPDWGAPGDMIYRANGGSKVLFSQSGLVDLKADDWTRRTYLPSEKLIKEWTKSKEVLHTPIAHDRTIHDAEAEAGFRELLLNSAFMHREGDQGPDVVQTWGRARGSEQASALNPETGSLLYRKAEHRGDQGTPKARFREAVAASRDSVLETRMSDLQTGAALERQVGTQGKTFDRYRVSQGEVEVTRRVGAGVTAPGEAWRHEVVAEEASALTRRGKFGGVLAEQVLEGSGTYERRVLEDGTLEASNRTWDVKMEAGGALTVTNGTTTVTIEDDEATIDNGSTSITVTGSNIYVGDTASSESEPLALGSALQDFLDAFKKWANKHTHTHPQGPTGPPMTPFARPSQPILSQKNYTD